MSAGPQGPAFASSVEKGVDTSAPQVYVTAVNTQPTENETMTTNESIPAGIGFRPCADGGWWAIAPDGTTAFGLTTRRAIARLMPRISPPPRVVNGITLYHAPALGRWVTVPE